MSYQLTLITGDKVRVTTGGGADQFLFLPHPDSRSESAETTSSAGRTFVIPSAARAAVAAGQLDRALFDVTRLIAQRYDDSRSATLQVIVEYAGDLATARSRARGPAPAGTSKSRLLSSIGARAASVSKSSAAAFWDGLATGAAAGARLAAGKGTAGVRRAYGGLTVYFSPFGRGPDLFDSSAIPARGDFALSVERNGEVIGRASTARTWFDVPARAGDHRISLDAGRDNAGWRYSTLVRSVWKFRSSGAAEETMPLLLVDLDLPQADLLNQVGVGRPATIGLRLRHQAGAAASAVTAAKLEISPDGSQWTEVPLRQTATAAYAATITRPAVHAGKTPSLRITATGAAGGKVSQQITRAYALIG